MSGFRNGNVAVECDSKGMGMWLWNVTVEGVGGHYYGIVENFILLSQE